jgi:hypothetical protein
MEFLRADGNLAPTELPPVGKPHGGIVIDSCTVHPLHENIRIRLLFGYDNAE